MTTDSNANNHPMVSIIIPIFNVASYIQECLDSIVGQEFSHDFEVILIDDCSTDHSVAICRQFVKQYAQNFRLLENAQNQGVSATRNRGLDEARGRYFMFIDPDDLLPPQALTALYEAAEQFDATIVKGNNTIFDESHESSARYNVNKQLLVNNSGVLTTLYEHDKVRGHPWGKLFRRERLGSYRFPDGVRMAQDLFYCSEVFSHATSLVLLNQNVYRYRNRDSGSTGRKYETGSYVDWLDSVESIGKFATSDNQKRAHKSLLVRTMTQIAREVRIISPAYAEQVLQAIEQRCQQWNIRLFHLIFRDKLGLRSISRYIKLQLALSKIRQNLSQS